MKLNVFKIDNDINKKIGIDITNWSEKDLSGNTAVIFSASTPSGYVDVSSIENIDGIGHLSGKDYKFIRDEIKNLFVNPWSAYTENEKYIFCKHKIGSQEERNSRVGIDNAVLLGLKYDAEVSKVRKTRLAYAKTEIHSRLPNNSGDILDTARDVIVDYFMFGREGTVQGDNEGITDYLDSVSGTTYESTGLSAQAWSPIGMSMSDLVSKVKDIILNGNY